MLPVCFYSVAAGESSAKQDIGTLIQNGYYDPAIRLIRAKLARKPLTEQARFVLLRSLAIAKEKQALAGFRVDTTSVIQSYATLRREFPSKFSEAALLWKTAWLNWQNEKFEEADTAAQKLLAAHARSVEASKAALLHAHFLIKRGRLLAARNILLRYFGLNANISNHEQRKGLALLAVIDESEGGKRGKKQAYRTMQKIIAKDSSVIKGDPFVYASYIRLLDRFSTQKEVLRHADAFVKRYITTAEASAVRLLQADALDGLGQTERAETIYGILGNSYPDRSSGKKAFIRKLMIDARLHPDKLNETLILLEGVARTNQLSDIEAESWLDQARLLTKKVKLEAKSKTQNSILERALENYALVAASEYPVFAVSARKEGKILLSKQLHILLQQKAWLQVVVLWRRFPQLRPSKNAKLAFSIAQAYIQLMDFSNAETLLDKLYLQSMGSIRGQRIILEKARLWVDRGDVDAAEKILLWLSRHEETLYRPGMLLIAANAQIKAGKASEAKQTLAGINAMDLMPALNHTYWLTRAKISTQLQRWHAAAKAWRHLSDSSSGDDKQRALYGEVHALIQGMDYQGALNVLPSIPIAARTPTWRFYVGLSAYRTGQKKRAEEQLNLLRNEGEKAPAYSLLARYMLDASKIDDLEGLLP